MRSYQLLQATTTPKKVANVNKLNGIQYVCRCSEELTTFLTSSAGINTTRTSSKTNLIKDKTNLEQPNHNLVQRSYDVKMFWK